MTQIISNSNAVSTSFIFTKEEAMSIISTFKECARAKKVSALDMVIYNLARGKEPRRGFTPITNPFKLNSNANDPFNGYKQASQALIRHLRYPTASASSLDIYRLDQPYLFIKYGSKILEQLSAKA